MGTGEVERINPLATVSRVETVVADRRGGLTCSLVYSKTHHLLSPFLAFSIMTDNGHSYQIALARFASG